MGTVFTRCPVAGWPVDTGIDTDDVSFRRFPPFVGRVFCPHCKSEHEWTKNSAWVSEEGRQPS
jgi:hypothetical protein